ncbi:DMT family transporter [Actinoplanes sp. NPDC051494]|uniref:DMT family transporter n=1 Tax=Actinoplanes sp. NPDC051494 TaxID=3363907 RepID=UPI0037B12BCA
MSPRAVRPLAALVTAALFWGSAGTFIKFALDSWQPMTLLTVQLLGANLVLWPLLLIRGYHRPRQLGRLALIGVLEPGVCYALITIGLQHTTAANAAVISGLESCLVVVLAAIFLRERLAARGVLGLLLAVVGVLVLGGAAPDSSLNIGDILTFGGILAAAVYVLIARGIADSVDPLTMTAHQFGFGMAVILPFGIGEAAVRGAGVYTGHSAGDWLVALAIGVVGFAGSFLLYNYALAHVRAARAGIVLNLLPVFGLVSAIVVLGERPGIAQVAGAGLIVASIFVFPSDADAEPEVPAYR